MQVKQENINSILIKIASPQFSSTGIVLPQYNLIITTLQNIYGNKQILIAGERFPRTLAKVLFIDSTYNFACIEAPAGVIFPNIKVADSEKLKVDERKDNNKEVNLGFTAEEAQLEAERCMRCYYLGMVAV